MTIADEAQRYLAVVEFFRAEGVEPHWLPESGAERAALSASSVASHPSESERGKRCMH